MSHGPTNNQQIFNYYFWSTYWVRAARKDQLNNMAIVIHVFHLSFEVRAMAFLYVCILLRDDVYRIKQM